jgi:enoyl-CoA hydratase/carnithine racemase
MTVSGRMACPPDCTTEIGRIVIRGSGRAFSAGVDIAGAHQRQTGDRSNADGIAAQERFAAMIQAFAALSPFGQKMTKQVYWMTADAPSLDHALALENRTQILANATSDAAEARSAFLEKRAARFAGR